MKKIFSKIASISLAFMVLLSTFSFTVEKHMCGDKVADYSFIGAVEKCNMPSETGDNAGFELKETSCCKDVTNFVEGTNSELNASKEKSLKSTQIAIAFVYSYVNLFEGLEQHIIPFKAYKKPLITKDFPVLFETFLI